MTKSRWSAERAGTAGGPQDTPRTGPAARTGSCPRTIFGCTLLAVSLGLTATACGEDDHPLSAAPYDATEQISLGGALGGKEADPDEPIEVTAKDGGGRITDVTVTDESGRLLAGELSADGSRWHSTTPPAAGARYTVRVSTEDKDGSPGRRTAEFRTAAAKRTLDVTFGPRAGRYGVGQPVTATLSKPLGDREKTARAVVEGALKVSSEPSVEGSWHWADDKTLHYRPREYWPAHATIEVRSALKGLKVKDRLYGGEAESLRITTGDRLEAITDAAAHTMTVRRNGEVINTIPVTTGKPGFSTRNGIKVVLGKEYFVRMRGTSIGIPDGSSESYDLPVYYATRVTWSGEYVHAAPWSVGSQGVANVSHGCVGMSTSNAAWFFETFREGDIVRVVNSLGEDMAPFGNGFGDWNLSWGAWREGSALAVGTPDDPAATANAARLRPEV
ncbi:Ig-like domain-containing protein [Streptomyces sp. GC420]|uniref:L,D-transpeptidase n=1 Tax=Streptomyces sp. GC420 TaxID=2697568 RepID=UPI0014152D27|nr:Ig-like domain-containing protein [Streptomyces sp. GC420]NBM16375.1 L,D-transpeptidase family protein [Streptomyces sp. GC420]